MADAPPIGCQRHLFDLPREVAWLNCAYMSPLTRAAVAAGEAGIRRKAHPWTIPPPNFFNESEEVRALFARLIGAEADAIAIVPSASYGIALAARNLPCGPGEEILILEEQFPSNVHAWRRKAAETGARLRTVPRADALRTDGGIDWTSAILAALGPATAIVALPNCHWTDGALIDLATVSAAARDQGAALVLDLTQSAGALPFDLAAIRPDFAVAASYKWLLGPYALGFLYAAPHRWEGVPLEENWITRAGSENFARLPYGDDYQRGARRFDMGERASFHLMPVARAGLEQLLDWGVEHIAASLGMRNRQIAAAAAELGFETMREGDRAPHYLGLRHPGGLAETLPARLAEHDIHVSVRGDSIRVTGHLWTDDHDVERFLAQLAAAVR